MIGMLKGIIPPSFHGGSASRPAKVLNRESRSFSSPDSTIISADSTNSQSMSGRACCFSIAAHARARAVHRTRARTAIAERQREGDELLHAGLAAFSRGDAGDARQLLTSAVERGARPEEALAVLERIDRLASIPAPPIPRPPYTLRVGGMLASKRSGISAATLLLVLAIGLAAGALVMIGLEHGRLALGAARAGRGRRPIHPGAASSPVGVRCVVRARDRLVGKTGRLRDALTALDAIRPGDPLRPRADELRAAIQQQLLEASRAAQCRSRRRLLDNAEVSQVPVLQPSRAVSAAAIAATIFRWPSTCRSSRRERPSDSERNRAARAARRLRAEHHPERRRTFRCSSPAPILTRRWWHRARRRVRRLPCAAARRRPAGRVRPKRDRPDVDPEPRLALDTAEIPVVPQPVAPTPAPTPVAGTVDRDGHRRQPAARVAGGRH